MDFIFISGSYDAVKYTPTADVTAGDAVQLEDGVRLAHHDIPADTLGALAAGGGLYSGPKTSGAIVDGQAVYLTTGGSITATASGNKALGKASGDYATADARAEFIHAA